MAEPGFQRPGGTKYEYHKKQLLLPLEIIAMDVANDPLLSTLQHPMDIPDEIEKATFNAPTRAYVWNRKAMVSTPAHQWCKA